MSCKCLKPKCKKKKPNLYEQRYKDFLDQCKRAFNWIKNLGA